MFTFAHRSWNARGYPPDVFDGRPVIGICNSWSELTTCNAHLRIVAEHVKRGVWEAGGLPLEFPTISLGESMMKPTTMLWRNLMSMDVEESLRANPLDGVVLLCGCDKTTPAQLMGAASADLPTIVHARRPDAQRPLARRGGRARARTSGASRTCAAAASISDQEYVEIEASYSRSDGHCNTMGTASTMTVDGRGARHDADRLRRPSRRPTRAAARSPTSPGRRIVQMVHEDLRLSQILTPEAFHNAIATLHALGGSTNAVIHLPAIAGRLGIDLPLERFDELSRAGAVPGQRQASGEYLMEEFFQAGGVPAVMAEIADSLELGALTATGATMGENLAGAAAATARSSASAREPARPTAASSSCAARSRPAAPYQALRGERGLLSHRGRAYVFETRADLLAHIDDDDLPVDADTVLVLKNGGPKGGPGMPEWGSCRSRQAAARGRDATCCASRTRA